MKRINDKKYIEMLQNNIDTFFLISIKQKNFILKSNKNTSAIKQLKSEYFYIIY